MIKQRIQMIAGVVSGGRFEIGFLRHLNHFSFYNRQCLLYGNVQRNQERISNSFISRRITTLLLQDCNAAIHRFLNETN